MLLTIVTLSDTSSISPRRERGRSPTGPSARQPRPEPSGVGEGEEPPDGRGHVSEEFERPDEETVQGVNERYAADDTVVIRTARRWEAASDAVARLVE